MNENGWENYSRLVLQQLEALASGIESLREELHDVKNQLNLDSKSNVLLIGCEGDTDQEMYKKLLKE